MLHFYKTMRTSAHLTAARKGEKLVCGSPIIGGHHDVNHRALKLAKKYFIVSQHLHEQ